jgi:hypothetical protein
MMNVNVSGSEYVNVLANNISSWCASSRETIFTWRADIEQYNNNGRAISQAVSRLLPLRRPGFKPGSTHVGFVVDKVALG